VRDPRGILNSREHLDKQNDIHIKVDTKSLPLTCQRIVEGLNYVMSETGKREFTNRYKAVR